MSDTISSAVSGAVSDTVSATRARLEETLNAIDDKLDVKKQAGELSERVKTSYESNPVPWIIGATAATVIVVGLIAWAIFSDD